MKVDTRKTLTFIGITFVVTWLLIGAFYVFGGVWGSGKSAALSAFCLWIPGLTAIVLQKYVYHEPVKVPLALFFKPNRWFFIGWILAALTILAINEVGLALPWHEYSPEMEGFYEKLAERLSPQQIEAMKTGMEHMPFPMFWLMFVQGLFGGITISAVMLIGNELGWRGFLQKQLLHLGFWKSSGTIGLVWGLWSASFVFLGHSYTENPLAGAGMVGIMYLLLAPILSYIRLKSRSIIGSAIFYGTFTSMAAVPLVYLSGASDFTAGITGLAGMIVLAVFIIGILLYEYLIADEAFAFAEMTPAAATVVTVESESASETAEE